MSQTLWVCLYLSLCVTVSVPLCVTIYPGVTLCVTHHPGHRWACRAHWCPELGPSPSHPHSAMGQAGRLFAMTAPGKHQDPEPKGHLPHLHSLPLSLPWTGLDQSCTGGAPKLETCPDPPPATVTSLPKPPALALPACRLLSLSVPLWMSAGLSASFCPYFLSAGFPCGSAFLGNDLCLPSVTAPLPLTFSVFSQRSLISLLS